MADPVVEISGGKIRGTTDPTGIDSFKGIPYGNPTAGPPSFHAASPAPSLAWGAGNNQLRSCVYAAARRRQRASLGIVGPQSAGDPERGLPGSQCLDPGRGLWRRAAGYGVAARRRIHSGSGQRICILRRRRTRAAGRRRSRFRQPSAGYPGLPLSGGNQPGGLRDLLATPECSTLSRHSSGCGTTSSDSAETRDA